MIKEITNSIYKLTIFCGSIYFIECETKEDLFKYILEQENKGFLVSNVNLIKKDGSTPKVAFRTDSNFKKLKKENNKDL